VAFEANLTAERPQTLAAAGRMAAREDLDADIIADSTGAQSPTQQGAD